MSDDIAQMSSSREIRKALRKGGRGTFGPVIRKAVADEFEKQQKGVRGYRKEVATGLRKTEDIVYEATKKAVGKEVEKADEKRAKERESRDAKEQKTRVQKIEAQFKKREKKIENYNTGIEKASDKLDQVGSTAGEQISSNLFTAITGPFGEMFQGLLGIDVGKFVGEKIGGAMKGITGLFRKKEPQESKSLMEAEGEREERKARSKEVEGIRKAPPEMEGISEISESLGDIAEPTDIGEMDDTNMAGDIAQMADIQRKMYGLDVREDKRERLQFGKKVPGGAKGEGGGLLGALGLGGLLSGGLLAKLGMFARILMPIAGAGLLMTNLFGEGGALEFFKEGGLKGIATGIATLLFGKSYKDKTGGQVAMGIMKSAGAGALIGSAFGPIGALIGGAIGGIGALIKAGIETGFFKRIFSAIGGFFKRAGAWIAGTAGKVWDWMKGIAGKIGDFVKNIATKVDSFVERIPIIGGIYKRVKGFFKKVGEGIGGFLKDVREKGFVKTVKERVKKLISRVKGFVGKITGGIRKFFQDVREKGFARAARDKIADAGAAAGDFITGTAIKIENWWNEVRKEGIGKTIDTIAGPLIDKAIGFVKNMGTKISGFFKDVKEKGLFKAIGENIGNVLLKVRMFVKNVGQAIGNFFKGVWDGFLKFLGIKREENIEDFTKGLEAETKDIFGTMKDIGIKPGLMGATATEALREQYKERAAVGGFTVTPEKFEQILGSLVAKEDRLERERAEKDQRRQDRNEVRNQQNQQTNINTSPSLTTSSQLLNTGGF